MIRCRSEPCALERDRLAGVMHDGNADEILISHDAARRIEVDPAGAGHVDLDPGMGVAAGDKTVAVIG